jgi:hypothetical protein
VQTSARSTTGTGDGQFWNSPAGPKTPIVLMAAAAEGNEEEERGLGFLRGGGPAYKGERGSGWREGSTPGALPLSLTTKEKARGKRAMTGGSPGAARERKGAGEEGCLRWAGLGQAQMGWTRSLEKKGRPLPLFLKKRKGQQKKRKRVRS